MTPRTDLYRDVHKGIRAMLFELVCDAGRTTWNDARAVAVLRHDAQNVFAKLASHALLEETFYAPLIREAAPDVAERLDAAHTLQDAELLDLLRRLDTIDPLSADAAMYGHAFYLHLSRFTGDLLVHMADEEQLAQPALETALDAEELHDVHVRLVASIPPQEKASWGTLMLPAMNNPERLALLANMRESTPPPVFAMFRNLASEVLSPADDAALERGLAALATN